MLSISEYIIQFMKKRKLSRNRLAEVLGYKSKTSIDRIINGTVRLESVLQFRDALEQAYQLSGEEKFQLNEAIAVFELGTDRYLAIREIWNFVVGRHETDVSKKLCIMDSQTKQRIELLDRYKHESNVHLTIVNCQYVGGLFGIIAQLLCTGCVLADHFIYVNDEDARTAKAISTLLSVFNEKGYMGYVRRKKQNDEGSHECGLIDSDLMVVSWETVDGKKRSDMILFPGPETGVLLEIPYMEESTLALIGFDKEKYSPFKKNYFESSAFEDYIWYSENYAALEKNRAVWKIKQDIGVDQIPAGILRKAVQEGLTPQEPGFEEVLDILESIYQKRYENTCIYFPRKN